MSGETSVKHLARLKVTYQAWQIVRNVPPVPGAGFTATDRSDRSRTITTNSLAELETALMSASLHPGRPPR